MTDGIALRRRSIAAELIAVIARTVHDAKFAVAGLRGRGMRRRRAEWDEQYRSGYWRYLDSASEIAHYMVIVGYLQHFCDDPSILDVGCGHGRLLQLLERSPFRSYLGIDHSADAIRQAQSLATDAARFDRGDFEEYIPADRFNAIIFNESIYYAPRPEQVLRRYMNALTPDGVMIVSMCRNRWQRSIWTRLESVAELVHSTTVMNEQDLVWDVRVLRPLTEIPSAFPPSKTAR